MLTHLSLFSGIGGLDLAAEWAGITTVGQCEWADYPTKVLEKHWPDVPRWRDIRTLTGESFYERTGLRTVDIISGGFPCQPFSVAGKQKGKGDDRYLWPEMLRVIRELTPRWVVGENVPGILRIAAADVVSDLEREAFDVVLFDIEAASVGAPHRRERVFFIANRHSGGCRENRERESVETIRGNGTNDRIPAAELGTEHRERGRSTKTLENTRCCGRSEPGVLSQQQRGTEPVRNGEDMAHADVQRLQGRFGRELQERTCERFAGQGGTYVADPFYGDQSGIDRREQEVRSQEFRSDVSNANGGRGAVRRDGKLQAVTSPERAGCDNGGRSAEHGPGERRPAEPGLGGVVDGVPRWLDEPDIPRVTKSMPDRANRLKCLGNAVVPQQAYPIFKAIAEQEDK